MYSLVHVDPKKEYGVIRLTEWQSVADGIKRNLVTVLQHYHHTSYSVPAEHLLAQVLQSISVPLSLPDSRYYDNLDPYVLSVPTTFGFTTPYSSGELFSGVFFHKDISEVIIGFDEAFSISQVQKRWEDATPVRVLRHPFPHLELQVPNGRFQSPYAGLAIIAVNVRLLAVQHRAFQDAERLKQIRDPNYVRRNTLQFLHMYVLPNMLESYVDYALFNRFECLVQDRTALPTSGKAAIHMPNYTRWADAVYTRLLGVLKSSDYNAPSLLAAIPAGSCPDMRSVMFVPDVVPTRQILWSVILARLPMVALLIQLQTQRGRLNNQTGLAGTEQLLAKLKRQRVFDNLPKPLYQSAMAMLDTIVAAL